MRTAALRATALMALALPLAACSDGVVGASADDSLPVLTSFYPLEYVAEQVGGEHVSVSSLTPAGAEPHDLELAPSDVAQLETAALVVHLSGFQPAVDDALSQTTPERVLDAAAYADLLGEEHHADERPGHAEDPAGHDHAGEDDDHGHAGEPEDHAGHDHGDLDPHFWLDPARLAQVAAPVAEALAAADPDNAADYAANAQQLAGELGALDDDFSAGLATCEQRTIVVSHEAYGYLAEAYDLTQVGISGLDPEAEPSPARIAEIGDVVRREGVTTIFAESLVDGKVAQTLAADLGVSTAVLDPVEARTTEGSDYQQVMRANLDALQEALACR